MPSRPPLRPQGGFTLVELLIVVIILAILATVAIPMMSGHRTDAVASSLMFNVDQVHTMLEYQKQKSGSNEWPASVDPAWFASAQFPTHPDQMAGVPLIQTVNAAGTAHPTVKTIQAGGAGAYWYNAAEGLFRARVKPLSSNAETLAYYNLVNDSALSSLGGTVDDGGGIKLETIIDQGAPKLPLLGG